jgi:cytochrome c oxidase subunit IV
MTETATPTATRRKDAHARPYLQVMVLLAGITGVEILFFTPFPLVPPELQALSFLVKWQILVVLMMFAVVKASFVAAYYMHLKYESWWIRYIPILPLIGVAALFATFAVV